MPQLLVQVICEKGTSLREKIARDPKLDRHGFDVRVEKKQGRSRGWTKIRSNQPDRQGALNLEWDADTSVLICRVVNRGKGKPNMIVGDFVDYLFERHRRRIQAVNIFPRD
jgi:hypothetical protein